MNFYSSKRKPTDQMVEGANATYFNYQVIIKHRPRQSDDTLGSYRLMSARQLFEALGAKRTEDVVRRFLNHQDDGPFVRRYRGELGAVYLYYR